MCTSLRGAAFFGASVHIAVGFVLFSRYVIATVVFTFYNFNDLFTERVTMFLAPFMVYITLLLALGLLIFHSVEKEHFFLLKWSSVAFSLLQLAVFVTILLLKLSPNYQYHQFPFLPDSLTNGYPPSSFPADSSPAGPGTGILTVPHGTILTEKEKSKSSDPPDPGGSSTEPEVEGKWREGLHLEIQRLSILISCVLLTLVYLLFLFLYIRQLNYEDTGGHVFGHAQAITRNIAFYVQPQFTGQQGNNDNNKLIGQVQRSQTQIPSQFLPQHQHQQQINQSPKKVPPLHQNQVQSIPTSTNPGELTDVQRSPARTRGQPQQQDRNNPQSQPASQQYQTQGNFPMMTQPKLGQPMGPPSRPISGGQGVDSPAGSGAGQILGQRGPIPAQVRINFYPKDLVRQSPGGVSPIGLPHNNIRPRGVPSGDESELRGQDFPLPSPLQQQQPTSHQYQQPPTHPPGQHPHSQHPQGQHPPSQHLQSQHPQNQHSQSQHPQGPHPHGQHPQGPHPQGQHPQGPHLQGQTPQGPHTAGPHQQGPHPQGQHSQGPHHQGQHPQGPHTPGQHPQGPHAHGQHQPGPHLQGQHAQGPIPQGSHVQGPIPQGQHQGPIPQGQHVQGPHLQGQHGQGPMGQGQPAQGHHGQGAHVLGPHGPGPQGHHQFQRLQYHPNPHQQLLHHSYPNQSDSASPASSVTYSPNPPRES